MAAAVDTTRGRRRLLLAGCCLTAAYLATRLALMWRFPLFVDETTFASYARDVHADLGQFFVAETDKKGLLQSWLGAALIGTGIAPITAMRLLAAAGAAIAAICGGFLMRRFYGTREGILTAGLIALGPYFLVTASVGLYDAMVTGLMAAAVLVSLWLAERPRLWTALLLGVILGAGGLTKPTTWAAVAVLPLTLLLFDYRSPRLRPRLLAWGGYAALALALGYAITSVARFSSLYDQPIAAENHRGIGQVFDDFSSVVSVNGPWIGAALLEYLTIPGTILAVVGAVVAWRRHRSAAIILIVWAIAVIISAVLLPRWPNPRYFATAMVPLAGFVVLGTLALWNAVIRFWRHGARSGRVVASIVVVAAFVPATLFDASVLADPVHATYPGLDQSQYVTNPGALPYLGEIAQEIERGGGPYPVQIDAGPYPERLDIGPWGLDLFLNGNSIGPDVRYHVFVHGTPAQLASARYVITDGLHTDAPPRPGYRLIKRIARSDGGAVMRLYERV